MQILLFGGPNATEFSAQGFDTRGCDHFALSNHPNKMWISERPATPGIWRLQVSLQLITLW